MIKAIDLRELDETNRRKEHSMKLPNFIARMASNGATAIVWRPRDLHLISVSSDVDSNPSLDVCKVHVLHSFIIRW